MSLALLTSTIEPLPYRLKEQALGYARALQTAAPEIIRDAGEAPSQSLADQLVFLAGIRKLLAIVDSNYWLIDNAGSLLLKNQEQDSVRVGGTDLSRGGSYHYRVEKLRQEFRGLLGERQVLDLVSRRPYVEIVRELASGR